MIINKTYYLVGIESETGKVELYNGGGNNPNFCILGKGLGKGYTTKKAALERIELLKKNYYKVIYNGHWFETHKFNIYKLETKISKEEEFKEELNNDFGRGEK